MAILVFAKCEEHPGFEDAARSAFPGAEFRPHRFYPNGSAAYVALSVDQLRAYEAWFGGVGVRARARLLHRPMSPGGALLLPVTYESWAVVVDGPEALGAAMEAAANLQVRVLVCPAFDPDAVPRAVDSLRRTYRRWQDRVELVTPGDDGRGLLS